MENRLRLLIVEDSEDDALLLVLQLKEAGYDLVYDRVDTAAKLQAALDKPGWDIVISDYVLPGFSGLETLKIIRDRGLDIPCLIVSGKIGEETAVAAMKAGAKDYIMKDNLQRLGPAIERELREAAVHQERRQAEEKLQATIKLSAETEKKLRQELELFNHKIIRAQEEERKRIVRELHEDTVQLLAIIQMELEVLSRSPAVQSNDACEKLRYLQSNTNHAMQDIRRFSYALRPGELDHLGLDAALEQLTEETNEQMGFAVEFQVSGETRRLDNDIELVLFRIAQEALNNTQKHSHATAATVKMEYLLERIRLTIEDNGNGFDQAKESDSAVHSGRLGLIGMRERAHLIQAEFTIESRPGNGTTIAVELKA
jgi:signal transduction histidine kinase